MQEGDLSRLEHRAEHHERATLEEIGPDYAIEEDPGAHRVEGEWIRDATLGANDGLVSVLTLIAGVAGAVEGDVVLLAGIAGVVAGAISMAVGAYVSAKAYRAYYVKELQREIREMRELPDVEREEIRTIYRERGFEGELLNQVVDTITRNPRVWLKVMMSEELGLSAQFARPLGAALVVFVAFVLGGVVPVVPFVFGEGIGVLGISFAVTALALLVAGGLRSRFTGERPFLAGLELIGMATLGVVVAYGIGRLVDATGVVG
jgi:VIT1/CCC1 family predicted Fe2+/Mn2+ transporter